jgi:hypothetical protein
MARLFVEGLIMDSEGQTRGRQKSENHGVSILMLTTQRGWMVKRGVAALFHYDPAHGLIRIWLIIITSRFTRHVALETIFVSGRGIVN